MFVWNLNSDANKISKAFRLKKPLSYLGILNYYFIRANKSTKNV